MNSLPFFVSLAIFLLFAIPSAIIDLRTFRIPDPLVYSGSLALLIQIALMNFSALPDAFIAAVCSAFIFYIIRIVTKGLGFGDVKFSFFIGLFCGLRLSFAAFLIAALTGMIAASILLLTHVRTRKDPIPFAPFLAFGAIVARVGDYLISIF